MPETTRTFIAVAIPAPLGEKLTRLQARLALEIPGVRWTSTLPFHVTLVFLGDVRRTRLESGLCRRVRGCQPVSVVRSPRGRHRRLPQPGPAKGDLGGPEIVGAFPACPDSRNRRPQSVQNRLPLRTKIASHPHARWDESSPIAAAPRPPT